MESAFFVAFYWSRPVATLNKLQHKFPSIQLQKFFVIPLDVFFFLLYISSK